MTFSESDLIWAQQGHAPV
ncbi:hypothetical protein F383_31778 [Gossypium arboreum]|uniref:Uncharacterized protein n=1 Tax=Gossypium arboreum TaxID=29729 RepID=A0A0B0PJV6_GOSAR|nr:hypothetical protein F383_31778 [Gossypium arboreum]